MGKVVNESFTEKEMSVSHRPDLKRTSNYGKKMTKEFVNHAENFHVHHHLSPNTTNIRLHEDDGVVEDDEVVGVDDGANNLVETYPIDTKHVGLQKNGRETFSQVFDIEETTISSETTSVTTENKEGLIKNRSSQVNKVMNLLSLRDNSSRTMRTMDKKQVVSGRETLESKSQLDDGSASSKSSIRAKKILAIQNLKYTKSKPPTVNIFNDTGTSSDNLRSTVAPAVSTVAMEMDDSIILQSLGFKGVQRSEVDIGTNIKNIEEEVSITNPTIEEDYLDYSQYADYYNDPVVNDVVEENILEVIKYRDYPLGEGYVRIPVYVPGLEMHEVSEVPQLWSAREAFMRQVGSKLYMFIPSAILGFLIGLLIWIVMLACLRIFGVLKKMAVRIFYKEKVDELDLRAMYNLSGDPWKKISDAERIHSGNGSIMKSVIGTAKQDIVATIDKNVPVMLNNIKAPGQLDESGGEEEAGGKGEKFAGVFAQLGRRSWRVVGAKKLRRLSH